MQSMTGFGQARRESPFGVITAEIRGVNHRFVDLNLRVPFEFSSMEPWVRAEVQRRVKRGKVNLSVQFQAAPGMSQRYDINSILLEQLAKECERLSGGRAPAIETLLSIQGVVVPVPDESRLEKLREQFEETVKEALDHFEAERTREGNQLLDALRDINGRMVAALDRIRPAASEVSEKYRKRLHERIEEMLGPRMAALDPGRLEQEVALFSDKADISEELIRLDSHLERLSAMLRDEDAAVGRQMEFLNQEILRETNTIGSKARDLDIIGDVLELKNLGESLREQAANLA